MLVPLEQLQPLQNVNIHFNINTAQIPISTLSTDSIELLSTSPPISDHDTRFIPFGSTLNINFQYNDDYYDFNLNIINSYESIDPTTVTIDQDDIKPKYSSKTTYKGIRLNELGQEEVLIATILPISNNFQSNIQQPNISNGNNGQFDTQSIYNNEKQLNNSNTINNSQQFQTLEYDEESGRHIDRFTISATFLRANGEIYQIETFTSLISLQQNHLNNMKEHYNNVNTILSTQNRIQTMSVQELDALAQKSIFLTQSIETLSTQVMELTTLQYQSSYDLGMYQLDLNDIVGSCGVKDNNTTHNHYNQSQSISNDQQQHHQHQTQSNIQSPLSTQPLFTFQRWTNCHPFISGTTLLSQRVYISRSYSVWASNSIDNIDPNRVIARVQHLYTLINLPYYQQFGIAWVIKSIVIRTEITDEEWNVTGAIDDVRCRPDGADQLLLHFNNVREENISTEEQLTSANHLLLHCTPDGVFTSGIAYQNMLCKKSHAVAWSLLVDPFNFITPSHETGHLIGLPHPFQSDTSKTGHYGGIMDYVNQHLRDDISEIAARGRIGFNQVTDEKIICKALTSFFEWDVGLVDDYVTKDACFTHLPYHKPEMNYNNNMNNDNDIIKDVNNDQQQKNTEDEQQKYNNNDENNTNIHLYDIITKSPTCGNNIVEPWEECDVISSCCENCKLKPNATCDGTNNQCCDPTTCLSTPSNTNKCTISNFEAGFCWRGQCRPLTCHPTRTLEYLDSCDAEFYFNVINDNECIYTCPTIQPNPHDPDGPDICVPTIDKVLKIQWFQDGASCELADGQIGMCLQTGDSTVIPQCIIPTINHYSWQYVQFHSCQCPIQSKVNGLFTCHDYAGHVVSSSYCESIPKPLIPECDCQLYYEWSYSLWNNAICGYTECGTGLHTRSVWCYKRTILGSDNNMIRVSNNECEEFLGPPNNTTQCQSLLQCTSNQECIKVGNETHPYPISICIKNDTEEKELTKSEQIFFILLFLFLAIILLALIICIFVKCHIPPFHNRNDKNKKPQQQGIEASPSFFQGSNTILRPSPSTVDRYEYTTMK